MDIVIFITKATQLDGAVQTAMPCIGDKTVVCSLINGLGNDDILLKYFPGNRNPGRLRRPGYRPCPAAPAAA